MIITTISQNGTKFIAGHEGFVSKAYLCPAGVLTIGNGFTMASKVFASYWKKLHGRGLRMGDTITLAQCLEILPKVIDEEYGKAVASQIGTRKQNHHDAASSMAFNCGTGSLGWKWATSLKLGQFKQAADQLRVTAVTANGRRLPGLVRRRKEEAHLLETGVYIVSPDVNQSASTNAADILMYQQWLADLGYYKGVVDGIAGNGTKNAVMAFQKKHGLVVDAIVGPATRAALIRAMDAKRGANAGVGSGSVVGAGGTGSEIAGGFDWTSILWVLLYGGLTLAAVILLFKAYQYRGKLMGNVRVPT